MTDDFKKTDLSEARKSVELKVTSGVPEILDDRYQLDSLIGHGATSSVYAGHELTSGYSVAIKILHQHLASDSGVVRRFLEEAKTAAMLIHPNIARVIDSGLTPSGQPYLTMERVDGVTLQEFVRRQSGWLPTDYALEIFVQICAALRVAHQHGVVHRDLKPGNIMIVKFPAEDQDDLMKKVHVKVLDFGVAKVLPVQGETYFKSTQTGETVGSILYMSPEQCLDQDVGERSDIYSLGCIMYEILTGKPPLSGRTAFLTMNQHLSTRPEPFANVRPDIEIAPVLEKVVFKAMEKDASKRQQTIGQLQDDLLAIRAGRTGELLMEMSQRHESGQERKDLSGSQESAPHFKPREVKIALALLCTLIAIETVKGIFVLRTISSLPTPMSDLTLLIGYMLVFRLSIAAAITLKVSKAKNWARFATGLIAVDAGTQAGVIGFQFLSDLSKHQGIQNMWAAYGITMGIELVEVSLVVFALILLFRKPSSVWFKKFH